MLIQHIAQGLVCAEAQSAIMVACRCVWQEESLEAKCIEGLTSKPRTPSRQPVPCQHRSCQGGGGSCCSPGPEGRLMRKAGQGSRVVGHLGQY